MMRPKAVVRGFLTLAASMVLGGCAHFVVLNDPLTSTEHNDLGVVYESNGDLSHAAKEYRRALKLDSHQVRARVNLGNIEAANERWRKSEKHYRRALADSANDADAMNNLAVALLRQGRELDEAHSLAERAAVSGGERAPIYLATVAEVKAGIQKNVPSITFVAAPPVAGPPSGQRIRLEFTAPHDWLAQDSSGHSESSSEPVSSYSFVQVDGRGAPTILPAYADSTGMILLRPGIPGTLETVWLSPNTNATASNIFVFSRDGNGNVSAASNGAAIDGAPYAATMLSMEGVSLAVPIVEQAPERCGQAALEMVLRYYGAAPGVLGTADDAYDAALHGTLITDLAAAARRAGYEATIATLTPESLIALVVAGVPPIVLYQNGHAPVTVTHFGVVTGWDSEHECFTVNDGGAQARTLGRDDLEKRWRTAGCQALIVRRSQP